MRGIDIYKMFNILDKDEELSFKIVQELSKIHLCCECLECYRENPMFKSKEEFIKAALASSMEEVCVLLKVSSDIRKLIGDTLNYSAKQEIK